MSGAERNRRYRLGIRERNRQATPRPDPSPEWREQALCARHPKREAWFAAPDPIGGRPIPPPSPAEKFALSVCAECPVILQCREYAIEAREPYGVWAGLRQHELRAEIRRRRPKGSR